MHCLLSTSMERSLQIAIRLTEPEFRADPSGEATDRRIRFRRSAGQELKDVLHLRHDLERHIDAGLAREIGELAAVVEQGLVGPGLDIHGWEALEVGMQRIGERVLAVAGFAEEHPGHTLDQIARNDK